MAGSEQTRTITESDRLKVVGLLVMAAEANRDRDRIARALAGVVGEESDEYGDFGHVSDAVGQAGTGSVYDSPDGLLGKLGIEVVPDAR